MASACAFCCIAVLLARSRNVPCGHGPGQKSFRMKINELNGHSSGSDGPMVTALKRYNGGRVLVFVMGAFAEMSGDVSRTCPRPGADPRPVL